MQVHKQNSNVHWFKSDMNRNSNVHWFKFALKLSFWVQGAGFATVLLALQEAGQMEVCMLTETLFPEFTMFLRKWMHKFAPLCTGIPSLALNNTIWVVCRACSRSSLASL